MVNSTKVSIGLPVYNGIKYIRNALDALLAQSFTDFELIISDNASTDGTKEICLEYEQRDSRIRYFGHSEHIDICDNFGFVLSQATGEYFMWAACDDWWSPLFIEELAMILDSNPDVVLAFCEHNHVDTNGHILNSCLEVKELAVSNTRHYQLFGRTSFEKYLLQCWKNGKVNMFYGLVRRRELLLADVLRKWRNFGWGSDILMVASILRYGDVKFSPLMLFHKILTPHSAGSAVPRVKPPRLWESIVGVFITLSKYLKFSVGIWQVQGIMPEARSINILRRTCFTLFVFINMIVIFFYQAFCALRNRLRTAIKGEKCELI